MGTFRSKQIGKAIDVQLGNNQNYERGEAYEMSIKKPQR